MLSFVTRFNKRTITSSTELLVSDAGSVIFANTDGAGATFDVTLPIAWPQGGTFYVHNTGTGVFNARVYMTGGIATFVNGATTSTMVTLAAGVSARFVYTNYASQLFTYWLSPTIDPYLDLDTIGFTSIGWRLDTTKLGYASTGVAPSATLTNIAVALPYTWDNPAAGPTVTLVGRTSTDTLVNKTLTSPTINSPTITAGSFSGTTSFATISATAVGTVTLGTTGLATCESLLVQHAATLDQTLGVTGLCTLASANFSGAVGLTATATLTVDPAARALVPYLCGAYALLVTGNSMTVGQTFVMADTTGADVTLNLPAATASTVGKIWFICNLPGGHNLVIHPAGTDTMDGVAADLTIATTLGCIVIGTAAGAWRHMVLA